ncbi:MAG: HAMP domain-containing histidine kinase [Verrucomicrobia subdivision 3 bacterium]|nr:HAMP domain-containing histidine kinase [Limisphaerales bacterium]
MAEFAAGAGHEMNNPLAVISGRAQLLLRGETDPQRRADLALIKAQATRVHEMTADLMLFARPPAPVKCDVDLVQLVRSTVDKLRDAANEKRSQLVAKLPDVPVPAHVDEAQITVVVRALVENALNAVGDRGRVTVELDSLENQVRLIVRDNGPGIAPEERGLIFDPYYSGRQAGRGLGMGLPKCWRFIQLHGGQLTVQEAAGGGAEFVVTLPTADSP